VASPTPPETRNQRPETPLQGVRVLELGEELSEFAGKLLAGAGADVLKVEPPGGGRTRRNGPFYQDLPGPGRSLYFGHYNLAKRGLTLDITSADGRVILAALIAGADVVLTGYDPPTLDHLRLHAGDFAEDPRRIWAAVTPFGLEGPYRDLPHSDLVQLAMGGQVMVCGYDPVRWESPDASPEWDTPPIAPQMWHTCHVAGNYTYIALLAALYEREESGLGQQIEVPAHVALDTCTEIAQPMYVHSGRVVRRQTGRHASTALGAPSMQAGGDGRFLHGSLMTSRQGEIERVHALLAVAGVEPDPHAPLVDQLTAFIAARPVEEAFRLAQAAGMAWAPVRAAEDNLDDPHFRERGVFAEVPHPDLGATFAYIARPWLSDRTHWRAAPRAPLPGEHNAQVLLGELGLNRRDLVTLAEAGIL
jgi:crotonobetainyl-CoA:carnitine CoA-transferase CaiB-like acyl-CoA transferase